jgi:hypothetical protein
MTFLNPLALFGLFAAGIPIVIHLLTRRRPKRIEFSSVEFLREVNVAQLRRFRLRELLLLALRVLAVMLLALSLSRPAVKGARGSSKDSGASVVLLIDRSGSMAAVEDKKALGTRASEAASSVLESLAPGDEVQIVPFDAAPEPLFPKPTADHGRASSALSSIAPRPYPTDLEAAVQRGVALLKQSPLANKELFLVSDLQVAGLPAGETGAAGGDSTGAGGAGAGGGASRGAANATKVAGMRFYVLPVGRAGRPENLALTGARLRGASAATGALSHGADAAPADAIRLAAFTPGAAPSRTALAAATSEAAAEVTVKSYGGAGSAGGDVAVGVRVEGRELGRAFVPLGAGEGTALVPLSTAPQSGGEAFLPEDALELDNHRWFAAGPRGRLQIGLVEGGVMNASPLSLALAAGQEAGQVDARRLEAASLSPGALAGLDALVLSDVPELAEGALSAVVDYARGGGAVAVALGPRAKPDFYGMRLFPALGTLRLGGVRESGTGSWTLRLAAPGHPAFEGFAAHAGDAISQAEFKRAWTLVPGAQSRVLARFATDLPALVEESRLVVFASDAEGQWNDFPTRGAFLPFWIQGLRALARGAASEDLHPGQRFSMALPVGARAADTRMTDPAGRPIPLEQTLAEGARRLVSPPLESIGLYRVSAGGRSDREVAVNLDARESDLQRLTPSEARRRWAAYSPVVLEGSTDLTRRIREGRFGREIAGSLLLAAFLCLLLETLLGRLLTPRAPGTPRA